MLWIYRDIALAFYFMTGLAIMNYVLNESKLIFHAPRPFWVSEQIEAWKCITSYGDPSGHIAFKIGIPLQVWLSYNETVSAESILSAWYFRIGFLVLIIAYNYMYGYSRMFLGVHTLD